MNISSNFNALKLKNTQIKKYILHQKKKKNYLNKLERTTIGHRVFLKFGDSPRLLGSTLWKTRANRDKSEFLEGVET